MCVLLTWMHINQTMKLFSDHSMQGWLWILVSFLSSLALNFVFNPLMWVVAGCYIHQARKENHASRWQFYPALIGVLLLASVIASVFSNVKIPSRLLASGLVNPGEKHSDAPSAKVNDRRAPLVSGIMFSQDPKALINGYVVRQGEEVEGFLIEQINESSVVFIAPDGSHVTRRVK